MYKLIISDLAQEDLAPVNNYVLVYKIDEADKKVIIHRVFYGGQNYVNMI